MSFISGFNENIFSIPIDYQDDNWTNFNNELNNQEKNENKQSKKEISILVYNKYQPYLNLNSNINPKISENIIKDSKFEPPAIVFSSIKNDRQMKSLANSSKLYVCEIFNYNWKHTIRKLVIYNKQKYTEKIKLMEKKEENEIKNSETE